MKKIVKKDLAALCKAVKTLKAVEGELRYKMLDNYLALKKAYDTLVEEQKAIGELVKEQLGVTESVEQSFQKLQLDHEGVKKPYTDEEKELLLLINKCNTRIDKDLALKAQEEVELDIKAISLDELKTLSKGENLALEVEGLLMQSLLA